MIFGIGVDCVQIARIKKSITRPHFVQRVFSSGENAHMQVLQGKRREERAAGLFAAKEAFLKAVGCGLGGFTLAEIEVQHTQSGAPYFALQGKAAQFCKQQGLAAHLSITHDGGLATAFVVLECLQSTALGQHHTNTT